MTTTRSIVLCALATLLVAATGAVAAARPADPMYLNATYDGARDPAADVQAAVARARAENRNILLEVGGDWCVWCHILDRYLAANAKANGAFARAFVIVKVNYDPQKPDNAFLGAYPALNGYPAFIVLDADGRYLAVQDTGALEGQRSYDQTAMVAFARRWTRP